MEKLYKNVKKITLTIILTATFSTSAIAEEYISVLGGASKLGNPTGNGSGLEIGYSGENTTFFAVAYGSGTVIENRRAEIEINYRKYSEIQIESINGQTVNLSANNDVSSFALMGNTYYEFKNIGDQLTPYITGGIGFARLNVKQQVNNVPVSGGGTVNIVGESDDTVFAYQLGLGTEYKIDDNISIIAGYRYFATTTAEFNGEEISDINAHEAYVGVKFALGQ